MPSTALTPDYASEIDVHSAFNARNGNGVDGGDGVASHARDTPLPLMRGVGTDGDVNIDTTTGLVAPVYEQLDREKQYRRISPGAELGGFRADAPGVLSAAGRDVGADWGQTMVKMREKHDHDNETVVVKQEESVNSGTWFGGDEEEIAGGTGNRHAGHREVDGSMGGEKNVDMAQDDDEEEEEQRSVHGDEQVAGHWMTFEGWHGENEAEDKHAKIPGNQSRSRIAEEMSAHGVDSFVAIGRCGERQSSKAGDDYTELEKMRSRPYGDVPVNTVFQGHRETGAVAYAHASRQASHQTDVGHRPSQTSQPPTMAVKPSADADLFRHNAIQKMSGQSVLSADVTKLLHQAQEIFSKQHPDWSDERVLIAASDFVNKALQNAARGRGIARGPRNSVLKTKHEQHEDTPADGQVGFAGSTGGSLSIHAHNARVIAPGTLAPGYQLHPFPQQQSASQQHISYGHCRQPGMQHYQPPRSYYDSAQAQDQRFYQQPYTHGHPMLGIKSQAVSQLPTLKGPDIKTVQHDLRHNPQAESDNEVDSSDDLPLVRRNLHRRRLVRRTVSPVDGVTQLIRDEDWDIEPESDDEDVRIGPRRDDEVPLFATLTKSTAPCRPFPHRELEANAPPSQDSEIQPISWKLPPYAIDPVPIAAADDVPSIRVSIPGIVREPLLLAPDYASQETQLFTQLFIPGQQALATPDPSPMTAVLNFHTIASMVLDAFTQFEYGDSVPLGARTRASSPSDAELPLERVHDATDADVDEIFFAVIDRWRVGLTQQKKSYTLIRGAQEFVDVALDIVHYVKEHGLVHEEDKTKTRKERSDKGIKRGPRGAIKDAEPAKNVEKLRKTLKKANGLNVKGGGAARKKRVPAKAEKEAQVLQPRKKVKTEGKAKRAPSTIQIL